MIHRDSIKPFVVAAAIFVATALGTPAGAQTTQSTRESQLQSLVNDAAFQLKLSYRFNVAELNERREEVSKAIAAWNKSSRSEADSRVLAEWLRGAIRASMPGSKEKLPALPEFEARVTAEPLPAKSVPSRSTSKNSTTATTSPATSAQPTTASEHTLMRPMSPVGDTAPAASSEATAGDEAAESADDFWSDHPASRQLPEELSSEDPFRDDPLPTDDDLFFE